MLKPMLIFGVLFLIILVYPNVISATIDLSISEAIVIDNLVNFEASMSGVSTDYYFQGVLRRVGSSQYFGATKNGSGSFIDYQSNLEKEYISSNFFKSDISVASWSGQINMRYLADEPAYGGPGSYELKLRRYTGNSGSPAGESNTLLVLLTLPLPIPSVSPTLLVVATPTISPSPTLAPTITPTPSPSPTPTPTPSISPTPRSTIATNSAEVKGDSIVELQVEPSILSPTSETTRSEKAPHKLATVAIIFGAGIFCLTLAYYLKVSGNTL